MSPVRFSSAAPWLLGLCVVTFASTLVAAQPSAATAQPSGASGQPAPAPAPSAKSSATKSSAAKPSGNKSSGSAAGGGASGGSTSAGGAPVGSASSSASPSPAPSSGSASTSKASGSAASGKSGAAKPNDKASKSTSGTNTASASPEVKEPPKPTVKHDPGVPAGAGKGGAADAARRLYSEAEQSFAAGDYRKAIDLFRQADKQVPRAELEFNIGLTYEAMGDKASALEAYRSYLRRAPTSADRTEVEVSITRLAKDLGKIERQQLTVVTSPAGATILIDAQPKGFSPWTGEIQTGRHQLTVRRIGSQEAMQNVSMGVDQPVEINLALKEDPSVQAAEQARLVQARAEQAERDRPTLLQRIQPITWGLMGAGAAGLVGAGAFEQARANSEDDARMAATQLAAEQELDSAESQQTTARVLLGVGAGAMILGGVFLYIDLSREPDSATQLTAGCAGRRCGLYARGNW